MRTHSRGGPNRRSSSGWFGHDLLKQTRRHLTLQAD